MEMPELFCKGCKLYLPITEFHKDRSKKYGYGNRCKSCELVRSKQTYRGKRDYVREHKNKPCADCGGTYPYFAMQFDHRPGTQKLFVLSSNMRKTFMAIAEEIKKCDVVCTNCHLIRTQRHRP